MKATHYAWGPEGGFLSFMYNGPAYFEKVIMSRDPHVGLKKGERLTLFYDNGQKCVFKARSTKDNE